MHINDDIFDTFPGLETERLILREIVPDDVVDLFRIYSDPDVMRYWSSAPLQRIDQAQQRIADATAAFQAREGIRWAIARKGASRLLGTCGHWRLMRQHLRSEIGYDLVPEHWGQGIMPEAVAAILQFGFERMGLHSVEAQIEPQNQASRRVLEKLGFVQ